jgi:hypothetical protein
VVTAEDAGIALGEPVGPARALFQQPLPVGRMRGCQYQAVSGGGSVSLFTAAGDLVRLLVRVSQRFGTRSRAWVTRPSCAARWSW